MSVLQGVGSSVPENVFGVISPRGAKRPLVRRAAAAKKGHGLGFPRGLGGPLTERPFRCPTDTAAQRQRKSRASHASAKGPNILGRLFPKRDRIRLVQFKQTGIVLLAEHFGLFAVGILQTRWEFLRQERLE